MEFETLAQKRTYEKIAPWMKELFGEFAQARKDAPVFDVLAGSAVVHVVVLPWGDDEATISTISCVVTGAELSTDLLQYLLKENVRQRFGAFGIDEDGDIVFSHVIVGSTCDKKELKASVMAVVVTADRCDDVIVARWGGQRALDR